MKYDGNFADFNMLAHQMQRVANPIISLTSEEQILNFLDNSDSRIWHEDYSGSLLPKGKTFDDEKRMDELAKQIGYNTRVVAFFYDKSEYAEEIKILRDVAMFLSNRYNLRIATVTDERLVTIMKKSHPDLFLDVGMSSIVLRRYDGVTFKENLAEMAPARYLWWVTVNSTKKVDRLTAGAYQLVESSRMPMINVFVDFSNPKVAQKSTDLIKVMEQLAPEFEERFKFFWTDEEEQLKQRRILGVTWDELPAIALNSMEHVVFAFPQGESMDIETLRKWLT